MKIRQLQTQLRLAAPQPRKSETGRSQRAEVIKGVFNITRKALQAYRQERFRNQQPLGGYSDGLNAIRHIDSLSDDDLIKLNRMLSWNCFTVDSHGRRFGGATSPEKRNQPEIIPDRRILLLHEGFNLSDKHVLEIGCLEGIHTIGLSRIAQRVTAIDARIENVVKTIVRCSFFDCCPTVLKCDVEGDPLPVDLLRADVAYHVGVLYHLDDPVRHLTSLGDFIRHGVMLDTHYALDEEADQTYQVLGRQVRYKRYVEAGYSDPFSGMSAESKWLQLGDITGTLVAAGFENVKLIEKRQERNGPRVLLMAERVTALKKPST